MIIFRSWLVASCVAAAFVVSPSPASAQRNATSKALGDYKTTFAGQSAGRSVRHAREYSQDLRQYSQAGVAIPRAVAKREAAAVQQNLTAAKEEYASIRKAAGDHRETVASLDAIDKQLANVDAGLTKLHKCCEGEEVDPKMLGECCVEIDSALEKVHVEHENLMKWIDEARVETKKSK